MRRAHLANVILFALGVALLIAVCREVGIGTLIEQIARFGTLVFFVILLIYAMGFAADVLSWQMVAWPAATGRAWFGRLFMIRAIGEVYNNVTPSASMAGEPVKVWLLKHKHDVSLADASQSLLLAKTAAMTSLTAFVGAALVASFFMQDLSPRLKYYGTTAFLVLLGMITVFVLCQRTGMLGTVTERLSRLPHGRKLARLAMELRRFDRDVWEFYAREKRSFGLSFAFAVTGWLLGVVEIFAIFTLLDNPISWTEALVVEAALQLVRTLAFIIPAGLGVQEVVLFVASGAIVGMPDPGVAAALVRRCRELVWLSLSLSLGLRYSFPGTKPC